MLKTFSKYRFLFFLALILVVFLGLYIKNNKSALSNKTKLVISANMPGVQVYVDNQGPFYLPYEQEIVAGLHEIEATKVGYQDRHQVVKAELGKINRLELSLNQQPPNLFLLRYLTEPTQFVGWYKKMPVYATQNEIRYAHTNTLVFQLPQGASILKLTSRAVAVYKNNDLYYAYFPPTNSTPLPQDLGFPISVSPGGKFIIFKNKTGWFLYDNLYQKTVQVNGLPTDAYLVADSWLADEKSVLLNVGKAGVFSLYHLETSPIKIRDLISDATFISIPPLTKTSNFLIYLKNNDIYHNNELLGLPTAGVDYLPQAIVVLGENVYSFEIKRSAPYSDDKITHVFLIDSLQKQKTQVLTDAAVVGRIDYQRKMSVSEDGKSLLFISQTGQVWELTLNQTDPSLVPNPRAAP